MKIPSVRVAIPTFEQQTRSIRLCTAIAYHCLRRWSLHERHDPVAVGGETLRRFLSAYKVIPDPAATITNPKNGQPVKHVTLVTVIARNRVLDLMHELGRMQTASPKSFDRIAESGDAEKLAEQRCLIQAIKSRLGPFHRKIIDGLFRGQNLVQIAVSLGVPAQKIYYEFSIIQDRCRELSLE